MTRHKSPTKHKTGWRSEDSRSAAAKLRRPAGALERDASGGLIRRLALSWKGVVTCCSKLVRLPEVVCSWVEGKAERKQRTHLPSGGAVALPWPWPWHSDIRLSELPQLVQGGQMDMTLDT